MSTEKLVAAIVDGDAQQIQQSFNQVMADKALEYIDAARQVVAQNMFNVEEEVDYLDEARADSSEKEYRDWSAEDHERESRPGGMYASDRKWHLAQAKKKRKAKNAVKEEVDYLDESCAAHELHVQPVKTDSGTKYKVLAVGKNFADGIKTGEHLSDTELDDASEIGAKIVRRKG